MHPPYIAPLRPRKGKHPTGDPITVEAKPRYDQWIPCWTWNWYWYPTSSRPQLWLDGAMRPARPIVYTNEVRPIPEGHKIRMLCRNRRCVNPRHMVVYDPALTERRLNERSVELARTRFSELAIVDSPYLKVYATDAQGVAAVKQRQTRAIALLAKLGEAPATRSLSEMELLLVAQIADEHRDAGVSFSAALNAWHWMVAEEQAERSGRLGSGAMARTAAECEESDSEIR